LLEVDTKKHSTRTCETSKRDERKVSKEHKEINKGRGELT
jgi:hypothetical protein